MRASRPKPIVGDVVMFNTREGVEHIGRIAIATPRGVEFATAFHVGSFQPCPLAQKSGRQTPYGSIVRMADAEEETQYEVLHTLYTQQFRI